MNSRVTQVMYQLTVVHSGFNLGGSRVERIQIFLIQKGENSLDEYKNLFKE